MPRRTIKEARQVFEQMEPRLSDFHARQFRGQIEEAESKASKAALGVVSDRLAQAEEAERAVLTELCRVRDELEDLAKRGKSGSIGASEYGDRFRRLARDRRDLEDKLANLEQVAERVGEIEADPVAWTDGRIYERSPSTRPNFDY